MPKGIHSFYVSTFNLQLKEWRLREIEGEDCF